MEAIKDRLDRLIALLAALCRMWGLKIELEELLPTDAFGGQARKRGAGFVSPNAAAAAARAAYGHSMR